DAGAFVVGAVVDPRQTMQSIRLILQNLEDLRDKPPSQLEVQRAIAEIAGSHAAQFESSSAMASALMQAQLRGLDESYIRNFGVNAGKVTGASVHELARKLLHPEDVAVVNLGHANTIDPQLAQIGVG